MLHQSARAASREPPSKSRRRSALTANNTPQSLERKIRGVVHSCHRLFEIGWAIGLKYTEGLTRLWPKLGTVLAMIISLGLLGIAMKSLPVGTAYSVWVGVGAVGTVALGIVLLGEPANAMRLLCIAVIIVGIVGLRLSTR